MIPIKDDSMCRLLCMSVIHLSGKVMPFIILTFSLFKDVLLKSLSILRYEVKDLGTLRIWCFLFVMSAPFHEISFFVEQIYSYSNHNHILEG